MGILYKDDRCLEVTVQALSGWWIIKPCLFKCLTQHYDPVLLYSHARSPPRTKKKNRTDLFIYPW